MKKNDYNFPVLLVGGIFIAVIGVNLFFTFSSQYKINKLKNDLVEK
jgi:hypothetical protein